MMLAVVRSFARTGFVPPRDIVLAFVADEEDTGDYGAGFLVREHADLFEGVRTRDRRVRRLRGPPARRQPALPGRRRRAGQRLDERHGARHGRARVTA